MEEKFNYGLIVVNPKQEGDNLDILHFVGYWEQPTQSSIDDLRMELKEDEEFGLSDIIHELEILPAPQYIVDDYWEIVQKKRN